MLLQTNSYVVPRHRRTEHARLLQRFRRAMQRVGCDSFEVYEQTAADWGPTSDGRFVQIMRFRDRDHQQAVREAERLDLEAQSLIEEFCQLINFPYQQEHGLFAVGFYAELDSMAVESIEPEDPQDASSRAHESDSGATHESDDADLNRVLDAGISVDERDIPMEAELLDEEVPDQPIDLRSAVRPNSPFYDPSR